jgi:hypothetical protein
MGRFAKIERKSGKIVDIVKGDNAPLLAEQDREKFEMRTVADSLKVGDTLPRPAPDPVAAATKPSEKQPGAKRE